MSKEKNPQMPDGTWAVSKEDKAMIVEFGRFLSKQVSDYANSKEGLPVRILAGALQYVMDVQMSKVKAISEHCNSNIITTDALISSYGLGDKIEEPFVDVDIVEPTKEEKIAALKAQISALEVTDEQKKEVEEASIAPSNVPVSDTAEDNIPSPYAADEPAV